MKASKAPFNKLGWRSCFAIGIARHLLLLSNKKRDLGCKGLVGGDSAPIGCRLLWPQQETTNGQSPLSLLVNYATRTASPSPTALARRMSE